VSAAGAVPFASTPFSFKTFKNFASAFDVEGNWKGSVPKLTVKYTEKKQVQLQVNIFFEERNQGNRNKTAL